VEEIVHQVAALIANVAPLYHLILLVVPVPSIVDGRRAAASVLPLMRVEGTYMHRIITQMVVMM